MSDFTFPRFKAIDGNGNPIRGGLLYTYAEGTTTDKDVYTDVDLTSAASNPVVLDSNGEALIYLSGTYKMNLKTAASAQVPGWPIDNIGRDNLGSEKLLSATTVSFAADADTTLYTVPTGFRCVLTKAIVVAGADVGDTTTISIGQDTAETDFIPANTLSNLDAQYDTVILQPIPNTTPLQNKSYAAATVIQAQVANNSGGASNTIYLYGILY